MEASAGSSTRRLDELADLHAGLSAGLGAAGRAPHDLASRVAAALAAVLPAGAQPTTTADDGGLSHVAEFIQAPPPTGLGSTLEDVARVLRTGAGSAEVSAEGASVADDGHRRVVEALDRMLAADQDRSIGAQEAGGPVSRDARTFGTFSAAGGWMFALMVARSVRKGGGRATAAAEAERGTRPETPGGRPDTAAPVREDSGWEDSGWEKVSLRAFARRAGCDAARVARYLRAWERAAEDGHVPLADQLRPGQEIRLPEPDLWSRYFTMYEATTDRQQRLAAEAEAVGTSFSKAVEITSNRPAMRAAILGDPQTAAAALDALLERPQERSAVIAQAITDPDARRQVAAQTRHADRIEQLQQVLTERKAKTPAGQLVDLDTASASMLDERLAALRDPDVSVETVNEIHDFVQDLVAEVVRTDLDVLAHEHRTKISRALSSTARSIQAIDPDDFIAFADDTLITEISQLQQRLDTLVALITRSA